MLSEIQFAELASVLSSDPEEFSRWVDSVGGEDAQWTHVGIDTFGTFTLEGKVYVAWKGTDSIADWLNNIFRMRENGIHGGFLYAYKSMQDILPKRIDYCIGHSRGAALASIAALTRGSTVRTYGSPRVFNKKRRDQFNKRVANCRRYVVKGDPVPFFPIFGYRHVKGKKRLNNYSLQKIVHSMRYYLLAIRKLHA